MFAGDDEAAIAVGPAASPEELAQRLVDLGAGQAVIKLGADGALALADGTITVRKAVPVTVRDTVGAGDAFVAGYLAGIPRGRISRRMPGNRRPGRCLRLHGGRGLGRSAPPTGTGRAHRDRARQQVGRPS